GPPDIEVVVDVNIDVFIEILIDIYVDVLIEVKVFIDIHINVDIHVLVKVKVEIVVDVDVNFRDFNVEVAQANIQSLKRYLYRLHGLFDDRLHVNKILINLNFTRWT